MTQKNILLQNLSQYPKKDLWRLFVDGKFHHSDQGWKNFEQREPGCLNHFFDGLLKATENIDDLDISRDLLFKLHNAVMPSSGKEFRTLPVDFPLPSTCITKAGLIEILDSFENHDNTEIINELTSSMNKWSGRSGFIGDTALMETTQGKTHICPSISKDNFQAILQVNGLNSGSLAEYFIRNISTHSVTLRKDNFVFLTSPLKNIEKLDSILSVYNEQRKQLHRGSDQLLMLIVSTIKKIERIHPFEDGNNRTFINLLLVRILAQNGFGIPTFYEPNMFDGFSTEELFLEVKKAIENTNRLKRGEALFSFSSDSLSKNDQDTLMAMATPITAMMVKYYPNSYYGFLENHLMTNTSAIRLIYDYSHPKFGLFSSHLGRSNTKEADLLVSKIKGLEPNDKNGLRELIENEILRLQKEKPNFNPVGSYIRRLSFILSHANNSIETNSENLSNSLHLPNV